MTEIVTFVHYLPDPDWRGWMIFKKQNFYDFGLRIFLPKFLYNFLYNFLGKLF